MSGWNGINPEDAFSSRIRQLRLDAGLTQEEMGVRVHLGKVSISQYENGLRKPSLQTIVHYASYFNVSADYLLGLSDIRVSFHEIGAFHGGKGAYTVLVEDDSLIPYRIYAGDCLRFYPCSAAGPGDVAEIEAEGKRWISICLRAGLSTVFLVDARAGRAFPGESCRIVAVAQEIVLSPYVRKMN